MRVRIENFAKYNPRGDVKNPSWVRLERNWWVDMWSWTADAQRVWFMLLGLVTDFEAGEADVDPEFVGANLKLSTPLVEDAFRFLVSKKRIAIITIEDVTSTSRPRDVHDTSTGVTDGTDGTGRDGTDGTTVDPRPRVDPPLSTPPKVVPIKRSADAADLKVGCDWLKFAQVEMPWKANDPKWNPEDFAEAIAKVRRSTGLTGDDMRAVLEFVSTDDFWRKNAVSPGGLLKKSERNGNRKVDNILLRMRGDRAKGAAGTLDAIHQWANEP